MTYKTLTMIVTISALLGNLSLSAAGDRRTEIGTDEKTIWMLEEAYISNHRDADIEAVIPFWHDSFLGWPDSLSTPADKKAVVEYTKINNKRPGIWTYKIEPKGIRIVGNIAVNHYILSISGTTTRVTHTWIKEGGQWKILGGMSNRQ